MHSASSRPLSPIPPPSAMSILDKLKPDFDLSLKLKPPSYLQVAVTLMPKRMTGIKHMLRPACPFLPLPISLGWQENPTCDDYPQKDLIPDLVITDIASGAMRRVHAPWMHALYTMSLEEHDFRGAAEVKLKEADFTQRFRWQHCIAIYILLAQIALGFWGLSQNQYRTAVIVLIGIILQLLEGLYAVKFPRHKEPRKCARQRMYALHKGMLSTHILVISHQPTTNTRRYDGDLIYINLEDASAPLPVHRKGKERALEFVCRGFLQIANIILQLACVISKSETLLIPLTLVIGTIASEALVSIRVPLPEYHSLEPLETSESRPSLLDLVLATCQRSGSKSIGFVESILPDKDGNHVDYGWITEVFEKGTWGTQPHPNHQSANIVHSTALRRRTMLRS